MSNIGPKRTTFTPGFDTSAPVTTFAVEQVLPGDALAQKIIKHMLANPTEYAGFVIDGVLHVDYQRYVRKFANEQQLGSLHPSQVELAKEYRDSINKLSNGLSVNENFVAAVNKAYRACSTGFRAKM